MLRGALRLGSPCSFSLVKKSTYRGLSNLNRGAEEHRKTEERKTIVTVLNNVCKDWLEG